jgi:HEAT repeat protein
MPAPFVRHVLASVAIVLVVAGAIVLATLSSSSRFHPRWTPGHQSLYRFEYRGEAVYQLEALFSGGGARKAPQRVYTAVTGTLVQTPVESDDRGATIIWNVVDPQVRYISGSPLDRLYEAQLRADLRLPFVARVGASGQIESVAGSPDASQLGVQFMRTAIGRIEVVAADSPSLISRVWTAQEPDADGSRSSTYTLDRWVSGSFGGATVGFSRASTLTVTYPSGSLFHRPDILGAGADRGVWRLDGSLDTLISTDARNTYYGETLIARSQSAEAVQLTASATLAAEKLTAAQQYAQRRLESDHATGLHVEPSNADVARTAFTNVLGSDDEQSLGQQLVDLTRRRAHAQAPALAQKFAALFYFHPKAVADYAPVLLRARSDSVAFDVLTSGFQQAGTPTALAALAKVAEARAREPHAGESLAISLGFVQNPTPSIDQTLRFIVNNGDADAASAAELALGSVAGAIASTDGNRALGIVEEIEGRLAGAQNDDAKQTELLALGNARAAASIGAILALRTDPSGDVRAAVATALRGIETPAADDALRELLEDPDPQVRLASATAFEKRSLSSLSYDALASALRRDSNADVRARAVEALWDAHALFPQALDVIRLARRDPDQQVRASVAFVLAAPREDEARPTPPPLSDVTSR